MTAGEACAITALTLKVGFAAVAMILLPGVALGYALARWRFPGRALVKALVLLPMVLPPVAIGLLLLHLFARGAPLGRLATTLLGHPLLLTWQAAAIAAAVMSFPLLVLGAQNAFAAVPRRLERVAASLGASPRSVLLRVTLPLAARGILHGVVFAFARALGEFGATTLVAGHIPGRTETLALAIYARIDRFDDADALRLSLLSVLLALLFTGLAELLLRDDRSAPR